MKRTYFSKIYLLVFFIFLGESFSNAISDDRIHLSISDSDLKIIENGDYNSASVVLYKMRRIYDKEGKDPIIPAISALIKRANNDLIMDLDEGEGELFGEVIWALSVTGDKRVEPVLLDIMVCPDVSSWDVAKGFLRIGKSTYPTLLNYLYSVNDANKNINFDIKFQIVLTFAKMGEYDSTGTYFTENDKQVIKQETLKLINDKNKDMRVISVIALGYFGDKSTIPILEEIKKNDPLMAKDGKYYVRLEADNAINKIMKRIMNK